MPLFSRDPAEREAKAEAERHRQEVVRQAAANREAEILRQRSDLNELQRGGIPFEAKERLQELGSSDADEGAFSSDLSPEEAALLRREGYRVRGLVTGSAMYHVGQAYASAYNDCEVDVLSSAYDTATALAVSRMRQELELIGAHGVVGVRFSLIRHEWADKTIEVQVLGTAVEGPGHAPKEPWMCDLSGQEWWALHRAGYEPAALVWGHCCWFILTTQSDEWTHSSWNNVEMTHWSQALSTARTKAMGDVLKHARKAFAHGIVGVRFERRLDEIRLTGSGSNPAYEREHHNLMVSVIGTGIRLRAGAPAKIPATVPVLSLLDGRLSVAGLGAVDTAIE